MEYTNKYGIIEVNCRVCVNERSYFWNMPVLQIYDTL